MQKNFRWVMVPTPGSKRGVWWFYMEDPTEYSHGMTKMICHHEPWARRHWN